ncbi:hypothetical protein GPALN_003291 [Globodera pallida]|nr:hypothetical protein GPALN_003291 [Globodera pallida]
MLPLIFLSTSHLVIRKGDKALKERTVRGGQGGQGPQKLGAADTLDNRNELDEESHGNEANNAEFVCREDLMKMELELKKVKEEMKKPKDFLKGELIAMMEQCQKQQKQNMGVLTKEQKGNVGLMPQQNRWDPTACHEDLMLSGLDRLNVQYTEKNWVKSSKKVFGGARYIDELKFVNARYLNNEIYVRSTQHEQNANKRNSNMIGFYCSSVPGKEEEHLWPHRFTPVAVHTIASYEDHIFRTFQSSESGCTKNIFNFWLVADALFIEDLYRSISALEGVQFDIEFPRIRGGPMLWILIDNMRNKLLDCLLKSVVGSPLCDWIKDKKYLAYSALLFLFTTRPLPHFVAQRYESGALCEGLTLAPRHAQL